MVIEEFGDGDGHMLNMFTLLNASNRTPYIKEFGGAQSLLPD